MTHLQEKTKQQPRSRTGWWRAVLVFLGIFSPILPKMVNIAEADSLISYHPVYWLWSNALGALGLSIGDIFNNIMSLIFAVAARFTAWTGWLLDLSVEYFVLNMAEQVNGITAIDGLWQTFRDLGNIAFIGVLLYIAIRTVLNIGNSFNTKQLLVRLVIVALFVNFSLFATKVVIDTSNVVALQFYNAVQVEDCGLDTECNLSHFFIDALNISSVNSPEVIKEGADWNIFISLLMGTVFMLVTAFVMGAMALLLIIRFVVLVLLMIASPLAFIAFALPGADNFGQQWIDKLLSQSFFAPAMLAMVYITASMAGEIQTIIAGEEKTNLMAAIVSDDSSNFNVILVYIILIGLMLASIIVAKKIGAVGATKAVEWGKKARNWGQATVVGGMAGGAAWAGRQTIGRGAQATSESRSLKDAAAKGGISGFAARSMLSLSDRTAQKSFDARNTKALGSASDIGQRKGGFREIVEDKEKKRKEEQERIESLSPEEKAAEAEAKRRKEKVGKDLEKEKKKLDQERKDVDDDIRDLKDSYNRAKNTIDKEVGKVNNAIKQREELRTKLAQAQDAGDARLQKALIRQFNQLTDDIAGVDNVDELEKRHEALKERGKKVEASYTKRKNAKNERQREIRVDSKKAEKMAKDKEKEFDKIINVGKQRGEQFTETMLQQQDILDNLMTKTGISPKRGDIIESAGSRANRSFAVGNVGDIKDKDRKERISKMLPNVSVEDLDLSREKLDDYDLDDES